MTSRIDFARSAYARLLAALALSAGLILASGLGCSSARMSDTESDRLFRTGRYSEAADRLRGGLKEQGDETSRDGLLYLLDIGLSLHSAGRLAESNQAFLRADKIADIKDYTSLATEGATLLTTDQIKDYKGEDFEKILINVYLSMNYSLMGDIENALVEARKVNRKLKLMITDGQRKYKQNAFAYYLSGILYESEGSYNDAYIDYKSAQGLMPAFPGLGKDLWRTALASGLTQARDQWAEEYHLTDEDKRVSRELLKRGRNAPLAEVIILYENGISPRKEPNPSFYQLPKFFPRHNPAVGAQVEVLAAAQTPSTAVPAPGGATPGTVIASGPTAVAENIEATAIENLDEKYGGLLAKKLAGIVAKEVVADQIGKHTDPALGFLAKLFFYFSDQADTRSWNLLPRDLQIARFAVPPGTYVVRARTSNGSALPEKTVQANAGAKVFVNFRYMP